MASSNREEAERVRQRTLNLTFFVLWAIFWAGIAYIVSYREYHLHGSAMVAAGLIGAPLGGAAIALLVASTIDYIVHHNV